MFKRDTVSLFSAILITLVCFNTQAAKIPDGSLLTISFQYKNNNNLLRNKTSPSYAVLKDGYASTIWIEGPYDPAAPCQISGFERQNIKLVRVITHFAHGHDRLGVVDARPNSWQYTDYNTPDFLAAVITAGLYKYCVPVIPLAGECLLCPLTDVQTAPVDAQRQNRTTGNVWSSTASTVCYPVNPSVSFNQKMGDITLVPDGITAATAYPDSTITFNWDMKDQSGNMVDEGYYLVCVQMSAERNPRTLEGGTQVGGVEVVGIETCWDDPAYDAKGNHRVVNLFHFRDSAFTKVDNNERKYSGDLYKYLKSTGMTFTYTAASSAIQAKGREAGTNGILIQAIPNPFTQSTRITVTSGNSGGLRDKPRLKVIDANGRTVRTLTLTSTDALTFSADWNGLNDNMNPLGAGTYMLQVKFGGKVYSRHVFLTR